MLTNDTAYRIIDTQATYSDTLAGYTQANTRKNEVEHRGLYKDWVLKIKEQYVGKEVIYENNKYKVVDVDYNGMLLIDKKAIFTDLTAVEPTHCKLVDPEEKKEQPVKVASILHEVSEDICDNYCKYRDTGDEDCMCDIIREDKPSPLDRIYV